MINRYDNPQIFQYQSQFVPTQLPWELIQRKAEIKQGKEDQWKATEASLGNLTPTGLRYVQDNEGNSIEIGDYNSSVQAITSLKSEIENLSKDFANVERGSKDYVSKLTELSKKANQIKSMNALYEQRQKAYEEGLKSRQAKEVNFGDHRGVFWDNEIEKMISRQDYTPENIAYQDKINRNERVNSAMSGIKDEIQTLYAGADGQGYIRAMSKYGITPEKVLNTISAGFYNDKELMQDVELEAIRYAKQNGYNVNSQVEVPVVEFNEKGEPVETKVQMSFMDAYKRRILEKEVVPVAMKYVHTAGSTSISTDSTFKYLKEQEKEMKLGALNLSFINQEVKGKSFWEAADMVSKYEQEIEKLPENIKAIQGKLMGSYDPKTGNIKDSESYLQAQTELTQLMTLQKNYDELNERALEKVSKSGKLSALKENALSAVGTNKNYWKAILSNANTPKEIEAVFNRIEREENIPGLSIWNNSVLNDAKTELLQTEDFSQDRTLLHWGTGNKLNKEIFSNIVSQIKIASDNVDIKDENGNSLNGINLDLDISAGYGIFTDSDGNMKLKVRTKQEGWNLAKDVIVSLDNRSSMGETILNQAYQDAKNLYEATGDSMYKNMTTEIETMILNNQNNIITSFTDGTNMSKAQNKLETLQPGSSWTYAQVKGDGSRKLFYTFTQLGDKSNPKYKVSTSNETGKNITSEVIDNDLVRSPQEVYYLMQDKFNKAK